MPRRIIPVDSDRGTFQLAIDDEQGLLEVGDGAPGGGFEAAWKTQDDLERIYRERIQPMLATHRITTQIERKRLKAELTLAQIFEQFGVTPVPVVAAPDTRTLDALVDDAVALLRTALNRGLGSKPRTVREAVLVVDADMPQILGFVVNPKALAKIRDDAELERIVGEGDWLEPKLNAVAKVDLEDEPLGGPAIAPYGDPDNLYAPWVAPMFHLACARLEADPRLRATVTFGPRFRVIYVVSDDDRVNLELHRLARGHHGKRTKAFFDAAVIAKPRLRTS
jgi:hypothetical protein